MSRNHPYESLLLDQDTDIRSCRYETSKLVQLLLVRELANMIGAPENGKPGVFISIVNPGAVKTDISRDAGAAMAAYTKVVQAILCRSAEEGSRTLVHAAAGGSETHGQYLSDCKIGE
jgi:retinol dehydrogenase 12